MRRSVRAISIFTVLCIGYFFVYFNRISVGVVGTDIVADIGGTVGVLSSVYFWTYALMQIPCGLLTDRFGPRVVTTVFLAAAAIGSLMTCVAEDFAAAVIGKILIAAGMAVVYVPLMKLVSVWFPARSYAALSGTVIAVGNIGAIMAAGPLTVLADAVGWRNVFFILGIVTAVLAAGCLIVVRDSPDSEGFDVRKSGVSMSVGLKTVISGGRRFWPLAIAYFLVYGTIMTFQGTWAVTYFDSVYGFAASASWMITVLGIGKIAGTLTVGFLASGGKTVSKKRIMTVGSASFGAVWMMILLLAGKADSYLFWTAVCGLFGFFGGFMTLVFAQIKEWYPNELAGTAVSATNVCLFLGAGVFTTVSGWMVGTSYTLDNFTKVWGLMTASAIVAFFLVFLSSEKEEKDPVFGTDVVADSTE